MSSNQADARKPTFIEAARREQIIECAIECIAERGYAGASLAQIAARAGISRGVINYYFGGKDELIEQVVAGVYAAGREFMTPRIEAADGAAAKLEAYIESNLDYLGQRPAALLALAEILAGHRDQQGRSRFDARDEVPVFDALELLLRYGQETGEFRSFSPRVMALAIRRAIDGVGSRLVTEPDLDLESYARELATTFDLATRSQPT